MNPERERGKERVLVAVGQYLRADQAEERALAVLAMGLPYWVIPVDGLYALFVDADDAAAVAKELEQFEVERQIERVHALDEYREESAEASARKPVSTLSLFVYGWLMVAFFIVQILGANGPNGWTARGVADSRAILAGQWWRSLTALTLHGDLGHLIANLMVGLIFAGALLRFLGTGWTWMGIVLSGAAGNLINAWGHRGDSHVSLGASTAVFGGLGLLVGLQLHAAIRHHTARRGEPIRLRELVFPIGAGLALLAYLGSGSETGRVDFMAHLFGMLSGGVLGLFLGWSQLPRRTPPPVQTALASGAILLIFLGWLLAYVAKP